MAPGRSGPVACWDLAMKLVEFECGRRRFGVEARVLTAVVPARSVVPAGPDHFPWVGWVRWDGQVWPVLDLAGLWWGTSSPRPGRAHVLIPRSDLQPSREGLAAWLVDRVTGVGRYRAEDFVPGQLVLGTGTVPCATLLDGHGVLYWLSESTWLESVRQGALTAPPRPAFPPDPAAPRPLPDFQESPDPLAGGGKRLHRSTAMATTTGRVARRAGDCWRRWGSWGDRSCPELSRVCDCRDCDVFHGAAMDVLERLCPDGTDALLVVPPASRAVPPARCMVLLWELDEEWWAMDARCIVEVTGPLPFRRVPGGRERPICGVVQWRGLVLPCVSLRTLLRRPEPGPAPGGPVGPRVVIWELQGRLTAWPVDRVLGLARVPGEVGKGPSGRLGPRASGLPGSYFMHQGRWVGWLDPGQLRCIWDRS